MASIRTIARQLGLSTSTVSLALRGVGRVAPATRKKIREAAAESSYRTNPLISKALSLARQPEATRYRETIAFILEFATENGPDYQKIIHGAAREQARTMGYRLEPFIVSGKPLDHRRLSKILHNQGIRGLIIFPRLLLARPRLAFTWEHFAAVEMGRTLSSPRDLHHVEDAHYNNLLEAVHLLKKVGYRRVGMAIEPTQIKHHRGVFHAIYLISQARQKERARIPIFDSGSPWDQKSFARWVARYQPDVLFVHDFPTIFAWLDQMGMQVPRDISLFAVNAPAKPWKGMTVSGLRHDDARFGTSAVEMVSLLLEGGELGLSNPTRTWAIEAFWQAGDTMLHSFAPYVSPERRLLPDRLRLARHGTDLASKRSRASVG